MAAIWDLPVLFVCENNLYATEVAFAAVSRTGDVAARGASYGIPGIAVDGNDVIAVYEAAGEAVRRARAGEGPTLLECRTYRTRAHSEGMRDAGYRTREEVAAWLERCPIKTLRERLLASDRADQATFDRIEAEIAAIVADAHDFALNSPYPDGATAAEHIFSNE